MEIEELYNQNYVYLKNFLIHLTKDGDLADDIIQELFSKILLQPKVLMNVKYMKSWLVKGAKNTLIDYYRKKKPDLFNDENIIESMLISHHSPESNSLIQAQIEDVLSKLSPTDKAIILAKEYYGYKYEEISELLDIPIPTLKSRVLRMKKRLLKEERER